MSPGVMTGAGWGWTDMLRLGALLLVALAVTCHGREVVVNQWLVRLNGNPGHDMAKMVAKRNGFNYVAPVGFYIHIGIQFVHLSCSPMTPICHHTEHIYMCHLKSIHLYDYLI